MIAMHQMELPLSPKWAIVGQSQGGGAAVNSRSLGHRIQSAGPAWTIAPWWPPAHPFNVESIVKQSGPDMALPPDLGPAASSYTGYILAGFQEARPDIDVNSVLTPAGLAAVDKAETLL